MDTKDIDHLGICFSDCGVGDSQVNRDEYCRTFGYAREWYKELSPFDARAMSPKMLEKRLRGHVTAKIKPSGFLPSVVWWFIGKAIMNYIIKKIMEIIMSKRT